MRSRAFVLVAVALVGCLAAVAWAATPPASSNPPRPSETQPERLSGRFPAPEGFVRVPLESGSFAAYLRELPLLPEGSPVLAYDGEQLNAPAIAVVDLSVGKRNLQQCADSIIRLHAEYLFAAGRLDEIAYRTTSGELLPFKRWAKGERPVVRGRRVTWQSGGGAGKDHASLLTYLDSVFLYAGTLSLGRDAATVPVADLAPGDFFVFAGSPGHAVLVLDLARAEDGRRRLLLGQGFMPAQSFHVLAAPDGSAWFELDEESGELATPSWKPFPLDSLRRLPGSTAPRP